MLVEVRSCTQIFVRYTYLPSKPTFVFEVVSNSDSKIGLEVRRRKFQFSSLLLLDFGHGRAEGRKAAGVGSQVDKQR